MGETAAITEKVLRQIFAVFESDECIKLRLVTADACQPHRTPLMKLSKEKKFVYNFDLTHKWKVSFEKLSWLPSLAMRLILLQLAAAMQLRAQPLWKQVHYLGTRWNCVPCLDRASQCLTDEGI